MLAWANYALLPLSLLASALMAGFFYAYSVSVMPGLAVTDPLAAIEAMRAINAVIRTAVFALGFFGALVFPLAAALFGSNYRVRLLALAAGIIYGLGAFAVTLTINVPLNDALAAATPTPVSAVDLWHEYAGPWTRWNHVRAIASTAALGLLVTAVVITYRR